MIWKPVTISQNHEVSSTGLIRNKKSGRPLKPWLQYGYPCVRLKKGGRNHLVHRLVAFAFIPEVPGKEFVNHKNSIRNDNRVENLEWCTKSENTQHAMDKGLITQGFKKNHDSSVGSKNTMTKLNEADVIKIRKLREDGLTLKQIGDIFNIHLATVGYIIQRKTWKHI